MKTILQISILFIVLNNWNVFGQPMTPKLPGAQAGDGKVEIVWRYDGGGTVDGFRIKRSLTPGGPYQEVTSSAKSPATDVTPENGLTYYYVVVAYLGGVESGNSPEVWAVPKKEYTLNIDAGFPKGVLPRYEQYHTACSQMSTPAIGELMKKVGVKYVRNMAATSTWTSNPGAAYNDAILQWGAQALLCIYRPTDKIMVYEMLKALKSKYPDFSYLEVDNEPDIEHSDITKYYKVSQYLARYKAVVEGVKLFHNDPTFQNTARLKIGGPAVAGCQANKFVNFGTSTSYPIEQAYVEAFLDSVKLYNLPIDFVSWHSYMMFPAELKRQGIAIRKKLNDLNLNGVKTIVTEWSGEKGGSGSLNPKASELARVASYYAAGYYQWMEAGVDMPMTWAVVNDNNHLKSQMVPGKDGKVYPLFNIHEAFSKMKTTRISCESDGLNSNGSGPGGIAAMDGNVLTIFVWNHNSLNIKTPLKIKLKNIPFSGAAYIKSYLIDDLNSNYVTSPDKDKLQLVNVQAGLVIDGEMEIPFDMRANSVALIEIFPNNATENIFPQCSISQPIEGFLGKVSSSVDFKANATDQDGTITKVEFFANGNKLGESLQTPFEYTWTPQFSGTYSVYCIASDNKGAESKSQQVNITVSSATSVRHISQIPRENLKNGKIFDLAGRLILNITDENSVRYTSLPAGIYILKLTNGGSEKIYLRSTFWK